MPEYPNPKLYTPTPPAELPAERSPYAYAELDVTTNFSFLRGASHPDELVNRAAELGYRAIGVTDINSLAGIVRMYEAAKGVDLKLVVGTRLVLTDAPDLLVWPSDRPAYARLCRLLTLGKRRTEKAKCELSLQDFIDHSEGMLAALVPSNGEENTSLYPDFDELSRVVLRGEGLRRGRMNEKEFLPASFRLHPFEEKPLTLTLSLSPEYDSTELVEVRGAGTKTRNALRLLRDAMGDRISLAASCAYGSDDVTHLRTLYDLSLETRVPLLATNHVHYHDANRRALQDVITCVRHGCTISQAGFKLFPNGERYLKAPEQMHRLFADYPHAIRRGIEIAERCTFSLSSLRYEYPHELAPPGKTSIEFLTELAWDGAAKHYPDGIPDRVRGQINHELKLIEQLKFEAYFLTCYDMVTFARSRGILCQGRGSAANSAVCYCIGVTSVDPAQIDVLFERFISAARNEPPDIDIDFEHERREEVIQYLYNKYGRERAGMTAEVITYRGRSAIRDVGKAMGLSLDMVDSMAKRLDWWDHGTLDDERIRDAGLDPTDHTVRLVVNLATQLLGFPRHLGQHVGGMVMTRGPLCEMVPIENAVMADRTVIEWDKDDIDAVGILKVDALALGMLTAISKAMGLLRERDKSLRRITGFQPVQNADEVEQRPLIDNSDRLRGLETRDTGMPPTDPVSPLTLIPPDDALVYDMISDADTVGVFQVESRAQMTMLPRLRPRVFYDLVIEVAIVRPGPIQGDMVHPYLRRRNGQEEVRYPSEKMREVLKKTLGVPLFQEQAMKLVMVGAGFTGDEADRLRRAMAAWKRNKSLEKFHDRIIQGMLANGYTVEYAEQCFNQIKGFGEYGFPESHAASFALLVYVSAWLKRHHPAAFCAALLNSQPMGFYAPAQLVRDAKEHGVKVLEVDVNSSEWDCLLEEADGGEGTRFVPRITGLQPVPNATEHRGSWQTQNNPHGLKNRDTGDAKHTWGRYGPTVRLGFRQVKGLREEQAQRIVAVRRQCGPFNSIAQFHAVTNLPVVVLRRLAEADSFGSLGLSRRQALWQVLKLKDEEMPLFEERRNSALFSTAPHDPVVTLPTMPIGQEVVTDYSTYGLSLKRHPVSLVREALFKRRIVRAADILEMAHGSWVRVAGLVLIRQRPGTASGVVFETLEDESGVVNLILWPKIYDKFRPAARYSALLQADGYVQRQGQVVHVLAKRLYDLSDLLTGLDSRSRDFH